VGRLNLCLRPPVLLAMIYPLEYFFGCTREVVASVVDAECCCTAGHLVVYWTSDHTATHWRFPSIATRPHLALLPSLNLTTKKPVSFHLPTCTRSIALNYRENDRSAHSESKSESSQNGILPRLILVAIVMAPNLQFENFTAHCTQLFSIPATCSF